MIMASTIVADVLEALAERLAHQVPGVDALEDDRELVRREHLVEVELADVAARLRRRSARRSRRASGSPCARRSPRRAAIALSSRPQYTRNSPRSASGSPSVAISQSSTATISARVVGREHRVVEAVVAVHDRRRRRLGQRGAQPARELVDRRAARASSTAPTARPSAAPAARGSRRDGRTRRGRPRRSRRAWIATSTSIERFGAAAGVVGARAAASSGRRAQDLRRRPSPSRRRARR